MQRFYEYEDAKFSEDDENGLTQVIMHNSIKQIIDSALLGNGYTVNSLAEVCRRLFLRTFSHPLEGIDWYELVVEAYEKHINRMGENSITPCRKCRKPLRRSEIQSGKLVRRISNEWRDETSYIFLCKDCMVDIAYSCYGLDAICAMCHCHYSPYPLSRTSSLPLVCGLCIDPDLAERENSRVQAHNKRAQVSKLPATLTIDAWLAALNYFNWKCAYCRGKYEGLEHYIPLSHGGGTTADNCLPACATCNSRKNNLHPSEFCYLFPAKNMACIQAYFESIA